MNQTQKDKILEVIKLCNQKIKKQKDHESSAGYGEDYTDGRIVGCASLARRILEILKELKRYRIHDTKENIAWNKLFEELPIGDQMLKLMQHLEKYCKKCGLYLEPRTYFVQKVNEYGSKEMIKKEFEHDEYACKCEKLNNEVQ